jgi:hypothetical protein
MATQVPWLRVFVEGLVIVASVLLALAADAWWDGVQLRAEVRRDLGVVSEELEENAARTVWQLDLMNRMVAGGEAMLELLDSAPEGTKLGVADTLAWLAASAAPTFDPSLGALDALIASGRLAAVDDPQIRLGLAGLRDRFRDVIEGQHRAVAIWLDRIVPATYPHFDYASVQAVGTAFWTAERVPGHALEHNTSLPYPNTQEIRNLIRTRTVVLAGTVTEMELALQQLEQLREATTAASCGASCN